MLAVTPSISYALNVTQYLVFILNCDSTKEPHRLPDVQYFDADILSVTELLPIFEQVKPDVVINTVSPSSSGSSPALLQKVNVEGTKCLLEASMKTGVKAFVYTSSSTRDQTPSTDGPPQCRRDLASDYGTGPKGRLFEIQGTHSTLS